MIDSDYVATMAAYNRWQNASIYSAAAGLDDDARRLARGAFFRSIHRTLSHLAWGDAIWLSRFGGFDAPDAGLEESADWIGSWTDLDATRRALDSAIDDWARSLSDADLRKDLSFYSGSLGRNVTSPMATCVVHFFNHQTHHRGQAHAMLTAAGKKPDPTDLFVMPPSYVIQVKTGG